MKYVSEFQLQKSFKILHLGEKMQLHHVTCTEPNTMVIEWTIAEFPSGFSLIDLVDQAKHHDATVHDIHVD